jgi:hypothetical protein
MSSTILWQDNSALQKIFDKERQKISQSDHPMAINYSTWFDPKEIIAYTMSAEKGKVFLCSTIGRKDYWPEGTYRVLNRLFKGEPRDIVTKNITSFWHEHVKAQVEFLKTLPDFRTAIISRKQGYRRALHKFKDELNNWGMNFTLPNNPIWLCDDYHNPECLQDVLFFGEDCINEFKGL